MTTCISCTHWNPKATDVSMLRHGFARCEKKALPGHTVSADAQPCKHLAVIADDRVKARRDWLKQQEAKCKTA